MRWTLLVLHQMRLYSSCCCPSSTAHQPSSLVQRSPRQHMWNSHCPFVDGAAEAKTNAVSPTEIWSKDSCHLGPGHLVGLAGRFAVLIWFLHFTVNFGNAVFVWRTLHITVTMHKEKELASVSPSSWSAAVEFFTGVVRYLCTGAMQLFRLMFHLKECICKM